MLGGWYCRSTANKDDDQADNSSSKEASDYESRYRLLKRKLKYLIYENESFQEALRSTQRKLLKANRDKSFLLDRLLHYEKADTSLSESEDTDSTDDDASDIECPKQSSSEVNIHKDTLLSSVALKKPNVKKKKKPVVKTEKSSNNHHSIPTCDTAVTNSLVSEGHMTPEEVERHLESRQSYLELVPEKAPPTVPISIFHDE